MVPIDWFEAEFWNNSLTVRERVEYVQRGNIRIALPAEEFCLTWKDCIAWKSLPKDEFMTKYGNAVLAKYNIPTAEEIERLEQYDSSQAQQNDSQDEDDISDDEDEDDNNEDGDDDLEIYN